MAKTLPNINKPVPEASDPALIKPVSDAIEAVDQAIGAKPSTLTTTAKTIVPAVNELNNLFAQEVRKYSNGTMIIERHVDVEMLISTPWGSTGLAYGAQPLTFGETFISTPTLHVTVIALGHSNAIMPAVYAASQTGFSVMLVRPAETVAKNYRISYRAKGRWK